MKHSKIGASSLYRWKECPGSVKLSEGIEPTQSIYAEEGTEAHAFAAELLEGKNPVIPDEEMRAAVSEYVYIVKEDSHHNKIQVEVRFDLSQIHPGLFGTADAVVYDPISQLLRVYDYKHGKGILVEVQDNPQLKYYGLGALLSTKHPCREVELVIVQPRANHSDGAVRRWRFSSFDLVEFAADLKDFAKATEDPNAPLKAGDHCRFCPAAGICPELHKKALAVSQTEFKPSLTYDRLKLSDTLFKLDMLEAYAKSVREFAYNEAEKGRTPPGWKLVPKRATRKWKDDKAAATHLTFECAFDSTEIYEPQKLKSVATIEKLMGKKEFVNCLSLVEAISSGTTLVPDHDPRQAITACSEFKIITD